MSGLRDSHERAMRNAEKAVALRLAGKPLEATEFMRAAYTLESEAAMSLVYNFEAEPSRGILFRSAAALAIEAQEYDAAERLAAWGMVGEPPSEVMRELRDVYEQSQFRRHLKTAGIVLAPDQVQMALAGDAIAPGMAETTEFTRRIAAAEKLFVRTSERKSNRPYREAGAASAGAREKFSLYVSPPREGSFTVTLQIGGPQRDLFSSPTEIIDEVLQCFELWQTKGEIGVAQRIPDEAYRRNFTALARELGPDGERVRFVGFSTRRGAEDRTVALTRPPDKLARPPGKKEAVKVIRGVLKKTDGTSQDPAKHTIGVVLDDGKVFSIRVLRGHEDVVRTHYGNYVEVVATKAKRGEGGGYIFSTMQPATSPPDQVK